MYPIKTEKKDKKNFQQQATENIPEKNYVQEIKKYLMKSIEAH